jgi:hypothetical protein
MCISLNRVIAVLATAAVIFSAVQPTSAQGLTIGGGFHGGFGGFHGGFGGFHHGFRMGGHFGRFNGQNFGRGLNGGIYGIFDSYGYGPYGGPGPYGGIDPPGYGYSISAASTGASSAYSGGLTGNYEAPGGDCVLYKLNYDDKGNYQSATAAHPCQ